MSQRFNVITVFLKVGDSFGKRLLKRLLRRYYPRGMINGAVSPGKVGAEQADT
jgi:hypothetical protein